MNAYELADYMDDNIDAWHATEQKHFDSAAYMLRQQADLIRNLQKTLGFLRSGYQSINLTPQTKPLSDDEIESIYYKDFNFKDADMVKFARAIEERHGIK